MIKRHLKKDDAVKALSTRAERYLKGAFVEDMDSPFAELGIPEGLDQFLDPLKAEMERITSSSETNILKLGLKTLPDSELHTLLDILKHTRGGQTEDKLLKMLRLTWPQIDMMDRAKLHIGNTQTAMVKLFVGIYAQEYHCYKDGSATFDNDKFKGHVQSELDQRAGASESMSARSNDRNCVTQ